MLDEAYQLLALGPDADSRTVEAAYWRRARELARQQGNDPETAEELERINWAYETLSKRLLVRPRPRPAERQPSWIRRFALAAAAAVAIGGGLVAGLGYREEIRDGAVRGFEKTQEGWDETITWLQSLGNEPTPQPPDATAR